MRKSESIYQKHLGIKLDSENHLKMVTTQINKTIGLPCKLQNLLPITAWITIYKAFVRRHFDYDDILYDQTFSLSFHQN